MIRVYRIAESFGYFSTKLSDLQIKVPICKVDIESSPMIGSIRIILNDAVVDALMTESQLKNLFGENNVIAQSQDSSIAGHWLSTYNAAQFFLESLYKDMLVTYSDQGDGNINVDITGEELSQEEGRWPIQDYLFGTRGERVIPMIDVVNTEGGKRYYVVRRHQF